MENFRKEVESALYLLDNQPFESYDGLSRAEMRYLIHNPFSENSPLQIRKSIPDDVLNQISLLRLIEYILDKLVEQGELKLTKKGFLSTTLVKEIYKAGLIEKSEKKVKLYREQDFKDMNLAMLIIENSGFTQKKKDVLSLTETWKEKVIKKSRVEIFSKIISTFALKIDWADFDDSPFQNKGQAGFAFTLYLLFKYGNAKQPFSFYVDKYLTAFPQEMDDLLQYDYIYPAKNLFKISYSLQTLGVFLEYLNFINRIFESNESEAMIERTNIFDHIIFFN
jgi:hypothetical protein